MTPGSISTAMLWFTCNVPNRHLTIGQIDTKTGEVTPFMVPAPTGLAGADPWHDARREGHHLVQRQSRARRPRPARSQDREDRRLHAAAPACRRPAAPPPSTTTARAASGRRRPTARCASIRRPRQFTEFKSVTPKTAERQRHHLWHRRRPRRQRLVGRDDHRHHRQGRRRDRQVDGDPAAAGAGGDGSPAAGGAQALRDACSRPTSTRRSRGRRARAAWAPTRTPTCSGSAIPGAATWRASTPAPRNELRAAARPTCSPIT